MDKMMKYEELFRNLIMENLHKKAPTTLQNFRNQLIKQEVNAYKEINYAYLKIKNEILRNK